MTDAQRLAILTNKFTILLMVATPVFYWFASDSLLQTMNPAEQFGFLGITSYWANLALAYIVMFFSGFLVFLMSVENSFDIVAGLTRGIKSLADLLKFLWDVSQTIFSFFLMWYFNEDWGIISYLIGAVVFGLTEAFEEFFFGASLGKTLKLLWSEMKATASIVAVLCLLATALNCIQVGDIMNRWHVIYGKEIIPTKTVFDFKGEIVAFDFVKNGSGRMPAVHQLSRQLIKVVVTVKPKEAGKEEFKFSIGIVTDEKIFSKEVLGQVLGQPLYRCKVVSDRESFVKGISVYLSTESSVPEALPKDLDMFQ